MVAIGEVHSAKADDATTAIRVTYGASGDCPGEAAFTSQLLWRTARVRLAGSDEARFVRLVVTVSPSRRGFAGRLEVSRADGHVFDREVDGDTCEEVVSALALITALAFDPNASVKPLPPAGQMPEAAPPSAPAAETSTPTSKEPAQSAPPPQSVAPPQTAAASPHAGPRTAEPRPGSSQPSSWRFGFGGQAALRAGITPDPIGVLPIFVEVELPMSEPLALALRASFERSQTDRIDTEQGSAAFRWTAGVLEGCPIQWARADLSARPCLRVEAGVLEAEGSRIVPARSERRPWVGIGAVGRAEWAFLEPAFAELGAGIAAPLIRDRFFFQPDTTVHRPAVVGWVARVGLGLRFP